MIVRSTSSKMERIGMVLLTILAALYVSDGYKILVVFHMPGKSHNIMGMGVVKHLLNAGHEVTYITAIPDTKNTNPMLTQVDVSSNFDLLPPDLINVKSRMDQKADRTDYSTILLLMNEFATSTLEHDNVQKVLSDPTQHFDLVIGEWMFNELYCTLAGLYQAPMVYFSTLEPHWMIMSLVDEYMNPAYNGWVNAENPPFNFGQRVWELLFTVKTVAVRETVIAYLQNREYHRLVAPHIEKRGRIPPSFSELRYNASLVLGNSHVSMGQATRIPQIYKPVGGYHIDEETKPLPEDLKKLLDEAKDGVIYFSMGSNLKSKDLPEQVKKELLEMFGTLKQTVLWKFEEVMPNAPKNVHILQWTPQQSILAHPNCILFITHGGLLSTTEAIHTATPIIGIPVFADQFINVKQAVGKGFAKHVPLAYTMVGDLKEAVQDMLTDPKYLHKVKELSFVYHDRPVKPGKELVHWVEHVIKTGGAPHLRSPALHVPWYQKIYLDLAVLLLIVLYSLVKAFKIIKPLVYRKKSVDTKEKDKQN